MKVGDLIKYESVMNDSMDKYCTAYGVVVQLSRTGHTTTSAQVLFNDGELAWFDTQVLEVVSEARR
tara:strand:- start:52 stop:249 length:198 start_codon:yes stop_codon:yes gene_type:complete